MKGEVNRQGNKKKKKKKKDRMKEREIDKGTKKRQTERRGK